MNTDFRVEVGFWRHRKTLRLIRTLGLEGPVSLQRLWAHAAEFLPDGVLVGMDAIDIAEAAGWSGNPNHFLGTLLEQKWIDDAEGVFFIHDWEEHQPWVIGATDRKAKAKKASRARWQKSKKNAQSNATSIPTSNAPSNAQGGDFSNAPSNAPSPSPLPSPKTKTTTTTESIQPVNGGCGGFPPSEGGKELPRHVAAYIDRAVSMAKSAGTIKTTDARYRASLVKRWWAGGLDISDAEELEDAEKRCGRKLTWGERKELELANKAKSESTGAVHTGDPELLRQDHGP